MTSRPPINLDSHRDAAGVMGAEMRRSVSVPATEARETEALRVVEMERRLAAPPASNWPEAAELALYLLRAFATTMDARDPRTATLIGRSIVDLTRLTQAASAALTERPPP